MHIENREKLFIIVTGNTDLPNIVENYNVPQLIISFVRQSYSLMKLLFLSNCIRIHLQNRAFLK